MQLDLMTIAAYSSCTSPNSRSPHTTYNRMFPKKKNTKDAVLCCNNTTIGHSEKISHYRAKVVEVSKF